MIEVAAAMGIVNLDEIDSVIEANRDNYHAYREGVSALPGIKLMAFDESECKNYQYVVIEVSEECPVTRDRIIEVLHAENILARKYFWPGCHNMKPYKELYPHAGLLLPNTQRVADRVIVLPTGTTISKDIVQTVTSLIKVLLESKQ